MQSCTKPLICSLSNNRQKQQQIGGTLQTVSCYLGFGCDIMVYIVCVIIFLKRNNLGNRLDLILLIEGYPQSIWVKAKPYNAIDHGQHTLKRKCCHFDEILITDCTESCHFDNFRCSQWWKFRQNDDISVSVQVQGMACVRRQTIVRTTHDSVSTIHNTNREECSMNLHSCGFVRTGHEWCWVGIYHDCFSNVLEMCKIVPRGSWITTRSAIDNTTALQMHGNVVRICKNMARITDNMTRMCTNYED